jgi:flagellar protein FliL
MAEEQKPTGTEEEILTSTEKKSKKKLYIVIIAVFIFVILVGAVGAFIFMQSTKQSKDLTDHMEEKKITEFKKDNPELARELGSEEPLDKVGTLYPLDPFTVNLLSNQGTQYLKVTLSLELSDKNLTKELNDKKAVVRDVIIRILTSKTYEEMTSDEGKEKVSQKIVETLNNMIQDGTIKNVYFTGFVIQ